MLISRAAKLKPPLPGVFSHRLLCPGISAQRRLLHQPPPPSTPPSRLRQRPTLTLKMSTTTARLTHQSEIHFGPYPIATQIFLLTPFSFALVNLKPLLPGHVLVCPLKPHKRLTSLSPEELLDLWKTVQKVQTMLARHYFPSPGLPEQGSFNIAVQDGAEAGQTVPHVHVHVIPRIRGVTQKGDGVGDELYERMAAEEGNVGGALWDREMAKRPVGQGRFDRIEDKERMARGLGDMEAEAGLYKQILEEMEREEEARQQDIDSGQNEMKTDDMNAAAAESKPAAKSKRDSLDDNHGGKKKKRPALEAVTMHMMTHGAALLSGDAKAEEIHNLLIDAAKDEAKAEYDEELAAGRMPKGKDGKIMEFEEYYEEVYGVEELGEFIENMHEPPPSVNINELLKNVGVDTPEELVDAIMEEEARLSEPLFPLPRGAKKKRDKGEKRRAKEERKRESDKRRKEIKERKRREREEMDKKSEQKGGKREEKEEDPDREPTVTELFAGDKHAMRVLQEVQDIEDKEFFSAGVLGYHDGSHYEFYSVLDRKELAWGRKKLLENPNRSGPFWDRIKEQLEEEKEGRRGMGMGRGKKKGKKGKKGRNNKGRKGGAKEDL